MADAPISFEAALADSTDGRRHLLIGNGFSIAWRAGVFEYGALLDAADFSSLSTDGRHLFDLLDTTDFERVIEALRTTSRIVEQYDPSDTGLRDRLASDADLIKDELARVIALRHPDLPAAVSDEEFASASRFLSNFERIYTLNYDLLLYWTAMHAAGAVPSDDGFRADPDDEDAPYVTWDASGRSHNQRLFYLHGALHLYDEGDRLTKFTWIRTQVRLIDQVRAALERDAYPLIVAEGRTEEKAAKILHSAYLSHGYRSFAGIGGSLFVFGHSLAQNDWHVLRLIPENAGLRNLFISVRGSVTSQVEERVVALLEARSGSQHPLVVRYFDAESAHVWR